MKKLDENFKYLEEMYEDGYYPDFLVNKVKKQIERVVKYLEKGEHSTEEIQERLDEAVEAINDLQDEFEDKDSEIETVARESIARTIEEILEYFNVDIDIETAIEARDW